MTASPDRTTRQLAPGPLVVPPSPSPAGPPTGERGGEGTPSLPPPPSQLSPARGGGGAQLPDGRMRLTSSGSACIKAGTGFGRWVTLHDTIPRGRRTFVLCRCDCGTERGVDLYSLRTGNSKSCGCLHREIVRARFATPYIRTGERFNRWTALEDATTSRDRFRCQCDCGTVKPVWAMAVRNNQSKSCGCLASEATTARNTTHGLRHHPLYGHWKGRCTNPRQPGYADYGGRGIEVCDRWRSSPDGLLNFIADMGPKPGPDYSVERINNDGHYEPGNCRWATAAEQHANMRPRAKRAQIEALRTENDRLKKRIAELEHLLAHLREAAA